MKLDLIAKGIATQAIVDVRAAPPEGEATAREIDLAVRDIVAGLRRPTLDLLHAREYLLRESAARLLERETLRETDLERVRAVAAAPVHPLPKAA